MNEARIRAIDLLPRLTLSADFDGGAGAGGSDTTIEAPELALWPNVTSTGHLAVWINSNRATFGSDSEPYLLYITAHTFGATTATIGAAPENRVTPYAVTAGCKAHHGPTRRDVPRVVRTSWNPGANVPIASATFIDISATNLKLSIEAYAGDRLVGDCGMQWRSEAENAHLDVHTYVSGSPVNSFALNGAVVTNGVGIWAWHARGGNFFSSGGMSGNYRVVSGDVSGGLVECRLRARNETANAHNINNMRIDFAVHNDGPDDEEPDFTAP